MTNILDGIGKDAELETNANGGSQSKAIGAMHLFDPNFLLEYFDDCVIRGIAEFMITGQPKHLIDTIHNIEPLLNDTKKDFSIIIAISKVLQEGAEKYGVNNWRLIPQEEHINHALLHYLAYLMKDKQDDHLTHCACRLMFAYATETSERFYYTKHKSQIPDMPKCEA